MNLILEDNRAHDTAEVAAMALRRPLWPGLAPLSLGDRGRLFGRDDEIISLVGRLQRSSGGECPVVWLHGDAGAGKTSLVQAGVLPRWSADYGSRLVWMQLASGLSRDGGELIAVIAEGILREAARDDESSLDLAGQLRQFDLLLNGDSSEAAAEYLAACFRRTTVKGAVGFLFIDQFGRSLSRMREEKDESLGAFLQFLRDLSLTGVFPILVALRSYHIPAMERALAASGLPLFGDWMRIESLKPKAITPFFDRTRSERVISGEMRVAPELRKTMAGWLRAWPEAIPLVSGLLGAVSKENPDAGEIDGVMVDWFGGLDRVFASAADLAISNLEDLDESVIGASLSRLMTSLDAGEGDCDRRTQARLFDVAPEGDAATLALIYSLVDARVLSLTGATLAEAEIAWTFGPGLMSWAPSRAWLDETRRLRDKIESFEKSRSNWEKQGRTPVCLIHGSRSLDLVRAMLARHRCRAFLDESLIEYLHASLQLDGELTRERGEQSKRRWYVVGGAATLIIVAVTMWLAQI